MKQSIHISGMTCNKCLRKVTKSLNSIQGVKDLKIDLKSGNVQLKVSNELTINQIAEVLSPKYKPSIIYHSKNKVSVTAPSKIKQLFPLFLILIYLIAGSILLQQDNFTIPNFMFDFMGLFFIIFSFFKFLDYSGFAPAFAQYDPIAKRSLFYGKIYPFIETALGIMLLIRWKLNVALIITSVVLSISTIGVVYTLFDKKKIDCACLGTALKLPMTEATLVENILMLIMSISMIFHQSV